MRVQVEGDKLLIGWYTFFLKVEIVSMATARMECCSGISDLRIVGRSSLEHFLFADNAAVLRCLSDGLLPIYFYSNLIRVNGDHKWRICPVCERPIRPMHGNERSDYIHYRNCQKDVARVLLNYREGFLDLFNRDGKVLAE